ncbi:MAG: hypothetical protein INH41_13935 [Myxococcaceae bacterium]|jgi:hypothetical protein|nr:hypothetical protein [Myxococcaceae bacterium]MCA3013479.1 hypothetical protein [Myxococcaceae bacterium]
MRLTRHVVISVLLMVVLVGCADGAVGENRAVRFSQVVNFIETDDFSAPLVAGRTVLIRLERTTPATLDNGPLPRGRAYAELALEVTGGAAQVLPLGFAQYAVRLDDPVDYRFVAKEGTRTVDAMSVKARRGAALRLHGSARVKTSAPVTGGGCSQVSSVALADVVLAPNQTVDFTVVPLDAAGQPMLGMLQLTASAPAGGVTFDTPLFVEGGTPNVLSVQPVRSSAGDTTLELSDPAFPTLTVPLRMTTTAAQLECAR